MHFRCDLVRSGCFWCFILKFCPITYNTLIISANDRRRFAARSGKINSMKGGGTQPQSGQGTCQSHAGERHCMGRAVHSYVLTRRTRHMLQNPRCVTRGTERSRQKSRRSIRRRDAQSRRANSAKIEKIALIAIIAIML